jgi:hypothetical protein
LVETTAIAARQEADSKANPPKNEIWRPRQDSNL